MATGQRHQPAARPESTVRRDPALARRHRIALLNGIRAVERALTRPADDPSWRGRVSVRLRALRAAFAEHIALTEGSDGLYAELLDHAPRLARAVSTMTTDHATVTSALIQLQRRLDRFDAAADEIRDRAGELLGQLRRHRQRGADLLHEAYATDLGGET